MSGGLLISYVVLWILVLVLAIALVSTLRNLGVVYSLVSGQAAGARSGQAASTLERGEELPDAVFEVAGGGMRSIREYRGSKLAFAVVSPTCEACSGFIDVALEAGPDPMDATLRDFAVIGVGSRQATSEFLGQFRGRWPAGRAGDVLIDGNGEAMRRWGISTTPAMVIVDADMRVVRQVFGGRPRPSDAIARTRVSNNGTAVALSSGGED